MNRYDGTTHWEGCGDTGEAKHAGCARSTPCPACNGAGFVEVEGEFLGIRTIVDCGACSRRDADRCEQQTDKYFGVCSNPAGHAGPHYDEIIDYRWTDESITPPPCPCTDEEPCAFHHDRAVEEAYQPNPAKWKQVPR